MRLTLDPELEKLILTKVQAGPYRSVAEVVGTALHVLDERDRHERHLEELRAEIQKGLDSGPAAPLDMEAIKRKGRARLARRPNGNPG